MSGPISDANRFDGLITFTNEQNYIGASDDFLLGFIPEMLPDNDPANSYYLNTRIEPDADCTWIVDNQEELFSR